MLNLSYKKVQNHSNSPYLDNYTYYDHNSTTNEKIMNSPSTLMCQSKGLNEWLRSYSRLKIVRNWAFNYISYVKMY